MNKTMMIIFAFLFIFPIVVIVLGQVGLFSGSPPKNLGVENKHLKAPSKNENSVSSQAYLFTQSEANVEYAKIEPLSYEGNPQNAFLKLKELIKTSFPEAQLITENDNYLQYEFKTFLMKYTDDVEFLMIENENKIHFRSASRLGRKDFGKNRLRMDQIREKYLKLNN